ncbi:MAG: CRISPR-associated helicase Cas3' [Firmicutes bacterium]|nr:CRISPR-associated helicase Cas3' [Bacillota bacterium]
MLLTEHLEQVAKMASASASGTEARELYSAGLLHDIGKARASWQAYIRKQSTRSSNHAFLGAVVFFWCWSRPNVTRPERYRTIMELTCDIANHHGQLSDLREEPPWWDGWQRTALEEVDWVGIAHLVHRCCPYLPPIPTDVTVLDRELKRLPYLWQEWLEEWFDPRLKLNEAVERSMRIRTACLIQADRFDAAQLALDPGIKAEEIPTVRENVRRFIQSSVRTQSESSPLVAYRKEVSQEVLARLETLREPSSRIFSMELPTGSGKTLLALQASLNLLEQRGGGRMIYVAPYLSILSQAADVMSRATGMEVLEHHHMAALTNSTNDEILREEDLLVQESWQAPLVATTFNQFFRALFPLRAHESMRLAALSGAVVVVDEPQIISPEAWVLFVKGLEQVLEVYNGYAILSTATLPPLDVGKLRRRPLPLVEKPPPLPSPRYLLRCGDHPWTASEVASKAIEEAQELKTCAIIVNTIRDAQEVYAELQSQAREIDLYMVTGAMTAIHKGHRIREIFGALRDQASERVIVVSTQVLEAGVDLSFGAILRARSLVPSIVQSAGRVNRHGENPVPGRLWIFDYVRGDGRSSREFVYRDKINRQETDRLLTPERELVEDEVTPVVGEYYRAVFQRHSYDSVLQKFIHAANGEWSAIGGLEPFEAEVPTVPVFVALAGPTESALTWLDDATVKAMRAFHCETPGQLFERYVGRGSLSRLDFNTRRRFMSLLLRFCVNMPVKRVLQRVERYENRSIVKWVDLKEYSNETGLAHLALDEGGAYFL